MMAPATRPIRTLYLCYFGLREPLVQSQVLPYLRQLAASGIDISLLTFEPQLGRRWTDEERTRERSRLADEGIQWFSRSYHKRPSGLVTAYDILMGAWTAVALARRHGINVLHARSHVAMAMAMLAQQFIGCRLVFDLRGLMAEEYADAGIWAEGSLPFRAVKGLERAGISRADQVVVLTERMRDWLVEHGLASAEKIEVIPCCVDFSRFATKDEENSRSEAGRIEVVYAGSVTGLYMLEEMGRFFLALRAQQPNAFFRVMTISPPQDAAAVLRRVGLGTDDFWIGAVKPAQIPFYFRQSHLGLSFRKPTPSQIAASPTKIPEYLAAGLPVVCNAGIGDMDTLLERERVGVVIKAYDDDKYAEAAKHALALIGDPEVRERCEKVARRYFDLAQIGATGYRNVYRRLGQLHAQNSAY